MGAIASQITSLTIFTQPFIQTEIKENIKARVTGLCAGNSLGTGEFPAQMASNAEMFPFDDVIMTLPWLARIPYSLAHFTAYHVPARIFQLHMILVCRRHQRGASKIHVYIIHTHIYPYTHIIYIYIKHAVLAFMLRFHCSWGSGENCFTGTRRLASAVRNYSTEIWADFITDTNELCLYHAVKIWC